MYEWVVVSNKSILNILIHQQFAAFILKTIISEDNYLGISVSLSNASEVVAWRFFEVFVILFAILLSIKSVPSAVF